MLRSDVFRRSGGRLLSVALLGGLALNAAGAPIDTMDAHGQENASQTWLTLQNGWLCRTWSDSLAASIASVPPLVTNAATTTAPMALKSQSLHATGTGFASAALAFDSVAIGQGQPHGVTHCVTKWHVSANGRLISDAPSWVPNPTGDWPAASDRTLTAPLRMTSPQARLAGTPRHTSAAPSALIESVMVIRKKTPPPTPQASAPQTGTFYTSPGGIGPWTPVPGHPSYGVGDFAGDPYSYEFGVCTWWAWYMRRDEPQLGTLGYASNWISAANAKGMRTGYAPAVGATVVFQPGVQGASGSGHVGHVVQLLGGGWFIISEMNFYWNGGGWGRVDYRYAHTGSGVAFIY